ncbi:ATP synthase subunit b [Fulvitalea axinellae]|uniref:ATP synthase subunit b n=1 Tax=Fulvitalea axinellae TaxID=1182444 RepID=A0AAU9C8F6_9BACT|nr:ATP synthase subunit b [Fulvitalea axinellae]
MDLVTPSVGLIFWQTIIFLLTLFLLGKFAWKPIMKGLKDREDSITEALQTAEQARKEMAKLKADNEALIQEARKEREKIVKDAEAAGKRIKEEAKEQAAKESALLLANAKASIEAEKNAALAQVKNQVAEISLGIAEKVLRKSLQSDDEKKTLVASYVRDLNNN